jgi:WD40 repeat protein
VIAIVSVVVASCRVSPLPLVTAARSHHLLQITYWDASDGNAIRIMDGSTEEIRTLAIDPDGKLFVSGGVDKLVKLWDYDEGTLKSVGAYAHRRLRRSSARSRSLSPPRSLVATSDV